MDRAAVNSITRLRIHADGVGVRSVVFLQGCPLDCFWCCNPETRVGQRYKLLEPHQLYSYIRKDIPYFRASGGGITFSGGEPLLWGSFLERFIREYCGDFSVDVETSLEAEEETVRRLAPLISQWNVDFKAADPDKHRQFTGKSNERILANLERLSQLVPKERILVTYPVIPGYNDSDGDICRMTELLQQWGLRRIELHPYRKVAEQKQRSQGMQSVELLPPDRLRQEQLAAHFREKGFLLAERHALYGKEKCSYLKELRSRICRENQLPVDIAQCPVSQPCIGTCPRCEYELEEINRFLEKGEKENV